MSHSILFSLSDFAIIVTASRHSNPMNIQNKSTVYTINNAAPPSYAEATEHTASSTYNPESEQRYPHIMVYPSPSAPFPYPSNCYVNNTPVQSAYPEYESTERQNQPISVPYNGTLITAPTEYKCKLK